MAIERILGTDKGKDAFYKTDRNFVELGTQINSLVTQIGNIDITNLKQDQTGDIPLDTVKGLVFGYSSIMQNKTGSYWCIVETIQFTSTYKIQKVYTFVDKILVRTMNANIWGDWREIITDKQPNWITATLQNGWTGTLQYSKNDLNMVTIKMDCVAGTITGTTQIANLNVGYRPLVHIGMPIVNSGTGDVDKIYINPDNRILLAKNSSLVAGAIYKGSITFFAG